MAISHSLIEERIQAGNHLSRSTEANSDQSHSLPDKCSQGLRDKQGCNVIMPFSQVQTFHLSHIYVLATLYTFKVSVPQRGIAYHVHVLLQAIIKLHFFKGLINEINQVYQSLHLDNNGSARSVEDNNFRAKWEP